ncbi:MAG: hypothetical protein JWL69_4498 [Phycisphaerales bacterium]|nr:hypothetical protein [Phycisphaerales bacterium]MDB5355482.1 hypothetical protein [Phycisphaerales bacterium]
MRRRIFTLLSALSLLLCVGTCVMWVRSYRVVDRIDFDGVGRSFEIRTNDHALLVEWTSRPYRSAGWETTPPTYSEPFNEFVRPQHIVYPQASGIPDAYEWLGFFLEPTYHQAPGDKQYDCWFTEVGIPYYFLFALTALPIFVWARRRYQSRGRKHLNLCPSCGYDLRATPDRCPECGAIPAR